MAQLTSADLDILGIPRPITWLEMWMFATDGMLSPAELAILSDEWPEDGLGKTEGRWSVLGGRHPCAPGGSGDEGPASGEH